MAVAFGGAASVLRRRVASAADPLLQQPCFTAMDLLKEMQGVFYENSLVAGDFDPFWRGDPEGGPASHIQSLQYRASDLDGASANFICVIYIGLEDDDEFCLVKRILGGCNMKKVTANSDAKVRLRGRGSGFLEGGEQVELDAPLQLHLSCRAFSTYCASFVSLYDQMKQLHKHYRRYSRSKQMVAREDLEVRFEELRRADRGLDFRSSDAAPMGTNLFRKKDLQRPTRTVKISSETEAGWSSPKQSHTKWTKKPGPNVHTIRRRLDFNSTRDEPGPGEYPLNRDLKSVGNGNGFAISLEKRFHPGRAGTAPGPGSYATEDKLPHGNIIQHGGWSISGRARRELTFSTIL
eukprot:s868_g27.t3